MLHTVAHQFHDCHLGLANLRHVYSYVTLLKSHKGLYGSDRVFPYYIFFGPLSAAWCCSSTIRSNDRPKSFTRLKLGFTNRYLKTILAETASFKVGHKMPRDDSAICGVVQSDISDVKHVC